MERKANTLGVKVLLLHKQGKPIAPLLAEALEATEQKMIERVREWAKENTKIDRWRNMPKGSLPGDEEYPRGYNQALDDLSDLLTSLSKEKDA